MPKSLLKGSCLWIKQRWDPIKRKLALRPKGRSIRWADDVQGGYSSSDDEEPTQELKDFKNELERELALWQEYTAKIGDSEEMQFDSNSPFPPSSGSYIGYAAELALTQEDIECACILIGISKGQPLLGNEV